MPLFSMWTLPRVAGKHPNSKGPLMRARQSFPKWEVFLNSHPVPLEDYSSHGSVPHTTGKVQTNVANRAEASQSVRENNKKVILSGDLLSCKRIMSTCVGQAMTCGCYVHVVPTPYSFSQATNRGDPESASYAKRGTGKKRPCGPNKRLPCRCGTGREPRAGRQKLSNNGGGGPYTWKSTIRIVAIRHSS